VIFSYKLGRNQKQKTEKQNKTLTELFVIQWI